MKIAGAPSARRLAPVAAAVIAVHLLLLDVRPDRLVQPEAPTTRPFSTRQIQPAPPPAAPAREQQAAPAPRPVPRAAAPPAPGAAAPVAPPAPEAHVDPQPPAPSGLESSVKLAPVLPPAASAVPPHQAAIPEPARVRYEVEARVRGLPLNGQAELHWRHDGSRYDARLEIGGALLPTRVQTSTGRITPEGLEPARFADKYRSEEATHFERDKGKLVFSNNRPEADLLAGTQDRLSVVVQLAAMLAGDPSRYPAGSAIAIPTAGTRDAETWVFTVEAEEDLQLPGGALRGLRLQRLPRKEYDYKLELWLAPRMDYAPVRLRLTYPNGDWVDQRWAATDKG